MVGFGELLGAGVDAGLSVLDLTERYGGGGFARRGAFKFKVHRRFGYDLGIAAGGRNLFNWGGTDTPASGFVVVTRVADTPGRRGDRAVLITAGAQVRQGGGADVLGSLTWRAALPVNLIVEWTGDDLGVGGSLAPTPHLPLFITPMVVDLTGNAGDGARLVFSAGFWFALGGGDGQ
jgi:hypothetical protein